MTTVFGYAKRDLRLAAYGGVLLQRFKFIKVCITLPKLRDSNNINRNFKLTMQLFKGMFRHDSCHHQFNVFPFSTVLNSLQFEFENCLFLQLHTHIFCLMVYSMINVMELPWVLP